MKPVTILLCALVLVLALFLFLSMFLFLKRRKTEGFAEEREGKGKGKEKEKEKEKENPLISLVAQLKRMSTTLVDPAMWADRLEMSTMSPVELARRHLQKL